MERGARGQDKQTENNKATVQAAMKLMIKAIGKMAGNMTRGSSIIRKFNSTKDLRFLSTHFYKH